MCDFLWTAGAGRWRRRGDAVLPTLRVSALVALAISILRPVLTRAKSTEEQGSVLCCLIVHEHVGGDRSLSDAPERGRVVGQLVALADGLGKLVGSSRIRDMADVHRDIRGLELLAEEVARTHREVEYARLSGRDPQRRTGRFEAAIQNFQGAIDRAQRGAKALLARPAVVNTLMDLSRNVRPGADREKVAESDAGDYQKGRLRCRPLSGCDRRGALSNGSAGAAGLR